VFQIVVPPEWFDETSKHGTNLCKDYQIGSFNLIINEGHSNTNNDAADNKKGPGGLTKAKGGNVGSLWR
jgi:hypothetical protein